LGFVGFLVGEGKILLVPATGPRDWAAKENREGGRLGQFRKETKIQPNTIERIEKKPFLIFEILYSLHIHLNSIQI
jgi:hypothetical protein